MQKRRVKSVLFTNLDYDPFWRMGGHSRDEVISDNKEIENLESVADKVQRQAEKLFLFKPDSNDK